MWLRCQYLHEVVMRILDQSGSLDILSSAQTLFQSKENNPHLQLSSWVPCWNEVAIPALLPAEPDDAFLPAKGKSLVVKWAHQDGNIHY